MKKLFSLLSVLTISGTAMPSVIAVIPYEKQEKLNNEINYLKENNLEKLNKRQKRGTSTNRSSTNSSSNRNEQSSSSLTLRRTNQNTNSSSTNSSSTNSSSNRNEQSSSSLTLRRTNQNTNSSSTNRSSTNSSSNRNEGNRSERRNNNRNNINLNTRNYSRSIRNYIDNNSSRSQATSQTTETSVFGLYGINQHTGNRIYAINQNPSRTVLELPLKNSDGKEITAILNPNNNLYMDGFIVEDKNTNQKTYWHFKENPNNIGNIIKTIEGTTSKQIPYTGHYNDIGNNELSISKNSINNSIGNLCDFNGKDANKLKDSLLTTIFTTSESMRFFSVQNKINELFSNNNDSETIKWGDYEEKLKSWQDNSENYIKAKTGNGTIKLNKKIFNDTTLSSIQKEQKQQKEIDDIAILSSKSILEQNN